MINFSPRKFKINEFKAGKRRKIPLKVVVFFFFPFLEFQLIILRHLKSHKL